MINENEQAMKEKINYFFDNKIKVHITLNRILASGKNVWLNGLVSEKLTENLFVIQEDVLGEIKITTFEILDIQEYKENEEDGRA